MINRICQIIAACVMATTIAHAEIGSPEIELGKPETFLGDGQFGLRYFPDERISVIKDNSGYQLLLAVETRSVLLQGPTLDKLDSPRNILLPGQAGEFDNGYAGVSGFWRAPSGEWITIYHAEDHEGMMQLANGVDGFYCRVALATSSDNGKTFTKRGPILSGHWPKNPGGLSDQGVGEPCLLPEPNGEFLYTYYTSHERVDGRGVQICLARCAISDASKTNAWKKYFAGQFSEPGLSGRDTPVLTSGRSDANAILPHVTWLESRKLFVMFYCVNAWQEKADAKVSGIYAAFSSDGIHWPEENRQLIWKTLVTPIEGQSLAWHPTLVLDTTANPSETSGWLYYGYSESWGYAPPHHPHYLVHRPIMLHWK